MCGIVGAISARDVAPLLLDSLNRLAYRGYDSAGIATLVNGRIERRRAEGKLQRLEQALHRAPLAGSIGIGHTRWATHGAPTEHNAHPHCTSRVSVVHNGIIENHRELRQELQDAGQEFSTDTDTEAVAQLLDFNLGQGMTPIEAVDAALPRLSGSYALAMIFSGYPDLIVAVQHGAPLAVGFGEDEMFVGSDGLALIGLTRRIAHLIDGDWAVMDRRTVHIFDAQGRAVLREIAHSGLDAGATSKGGFAHYMEKELHEHPLVIRDTLAAVIDPASRAVALPVLP
jgi:glucosamine--fructose-6-phosphate aminotransferase (isomerizing)